MAVANPVGSAASGSGPSNLRVVSFNPDDFVSPKRCWPRAANPQELLAYARQQGASPRQLEVARELLERGLFKKAQRIALCGLVGGRLRCENGHEFYSHFRCGLGCCESCAPQVQNKLRAKLQRQLAEVLPGLEQACVAEGRKPVIATLEFTVDGTVTSAEAIRRLGTQVKEFWRRAGIGRHEGLVWNSGLGAHQTPTVRAFYIGAKVEDAERIWTEVAGSEATVRITTEHSDSPEWVKEQAIKSGLDFAIQPFPSESNPARAAEQEALMTGTRRLHTAGAFYGRKGSPTSVEGISSAPQDGEVLFAARIRENRCPLCRSPLVVEGHWEPIARLREEGLEDLDEVRRRVGSPHFP